MNNEPLLIVVFCIVVLGVMLIQGIWIIVHSVTHIFKNIRYGKIEMFYVVTAILGTLAEIKGIKVIISLLERFVK